MTTQPITASVANSTPSAEHRRQFIVAMLAELDHAYAKHGARPWSRHEFYAILKEEVDEAWDAIKGDDPVPDLLKEIMQIACVCLRYVETPDAYRGIAPLPLPSRAIPGSSTSTAPASGKRYVVVNSNVHADGWVVRDSEGGGVWAFSSQGAAACAADLANAAFAAGRASAIGPPVIEPPFVMEGAASTATRDFGQGGEKCKRCNGTGKYWWNHPNDGPQEVACECVPQPTPSVGSGEEVAWLIERGQPEGQHPPCWLKCNGSQDGYEWVYDANDATKYPTKNAANSALVARSGIANVHSRWAHVTEHVFISQPPPTPDLRAVATTLFKALDEYLDVLDNAPEEASTSEIRYARSLARTALRPGPATRAQENGT